jgi:hypothetical protein
LTEREADLARARAEHTRLNTAIRNLLIVVEKGIMNPRDTAFAERLAENQTARAAVSSRIEILEAQLAKGKRQIDEQTIERFGAMLRQKMRCHDNSLRSSYLKMFVGEVRVGLSRSSSRVRYRRWKTAWPSDFPSKRARCPSLTGSGAAYRTRTCDPRITNAMLYQLS